MDHINDLFNNEEQSHKRILRRQCALRPISSTNREYQGYQDQSKQLEEPQSWQFNLNKRILIRQDTLRAKGPRIRHNTEH
jgi:hypothetical protein